MEQIYRNISETHIPSKIDVKDDQERLCVDASNLPTMSRHNNNPITTMIHVDVSSDFVSEPIDEN